MSVTANGGSERIVEMNFGTMPGCTTTIVSGCSVTECTTIDRGPSAPSPGKVTVSSTTLGSVDLTTDSFGLARAIQPGALPSGESIAFKSAGDKVPAFDTTLKTPSAPGNVTVGGCALGASSCTLKLDAAPFAIWSGVTDGNVRIGLSFVAAGRDVSVSCSYTGPSGGGRLPADVAAKLPGAATGTVTVSSVNNTTVDAGTHRTTISAVTLPKSWSIGAKTP